MSTSLTCPHCGKDIELTEAIKHQVEENLKKQLAQKHAEELEATKKTVAEEIKKQYEKNQLLELTDMQKQIAEKDKKLDELIQNELKLREERRKLEEDRKEMELAVQRQLDEEKKKIEETVLKQAVDEHRLKDMEKEKKIMDLQNKLEDALRQAKVGSQQLQGEVLELDLESTLKTTFPSDEFEPIGKGVRGADIRQIVKSPKGFICGVILWESKRTKAWSDGWCSKLKEDMRAEHANIPVIVSVALPKAASEGFGIHDGVWVCGYTLVIPIASILRKNLLDVGFEKAKVAHRGEKADILYDYITSHEFKQQVEALVEVYKEMQLQIVKERTAFEKIWKAREGQLSRLMSSTATVVGSIQGRIGQTALQVKGMDLLELEDGLT